jgi:hypothetical protein
MQVAGALTEVRPVDQRRVHEQDEAGKADHSTRQLARRQRLLRQNQTKRDGPERHGVSEHDRATGGDDSQPDDAEDDKPRHLEETNPEQSDPLAWDRQQRAAQHSEYRGEESDAPRHTQRDKDHRLGMSQGQPHQGPVGSPRRDHPPEIEIGEARCRAGDRFQLAHA